MTASSNHGADPTAGITREAVLSEPLHARPAGALVQLMADRGSDQLVVQAGERVANGRSILSLLALGAVAGTTVVLHAEGPTAETTLELAAAVLTS